MNQALENMLAVVCREHPDTWDEYVDICISAYNSTPSRATGYSPHMMIFGQEKLMPIDIVYGVLNRPGEDLSGQCNCEFTANLERRLKYVHAMAVKELGSYCERMKERYDLNLNQKQFAPGDWVLRYYPPNKQKVLAGPTIGPYVVTRKCSEYVYEIQVRPGATKLTVHANDLRKCKSLLGEPNWVKNAILAEKPPQVNVRAAQRVQENAQVARVKQTNSSTQWSQEDIQVRRSNRTTKKPDTLCYA